MLSGLYVRRRARLFFFFFLLCFPLYRSEAGGDYPTNPKKEKVDPALLPWGLRVFSLAFVSADEIADVRDQGLLKPKAKRV